MASTYISCVTHGFALPSHSRKTRSNTATWPQNQSKPTTVITMADHATITNKPPIVRRSANYPPSQWSYDYLQSLNATSYTGGSGENAEKEKTEEHPESPPSSPGENYKISSQSMKETVGMMISNNGTSPLSTLEFIDDLQRLGISYHFQDEINNLLNMIYHCYYETQEKWNRMDLNLKSLGFRLLRQHGYHIPQEIFEDIKDETGNIKAHIGEDIVGMLNLYEASFHATEDENILDEAREFTTKCLKEKLEKKSVNNVDATSSSMWMLVSHALELPLHWMVPRFEALWFIETYKKRSDMKLLLLELAKLDFNIVQGIHQQDLKYSSRWWDGLGWNKKLSFARDRLVESFMWSVGSHYEPPFGVVRRNITKLISLVNVIDDAYDVYGTLDELEQFTQVVKRWDINAMEELPVYMKICFLGFYNTINEMAYNTLTDQESLVIPYVRKAWEEYCDANLVEARWFNSGYTPTLEEYLNNSCITISVIVIISSAYFFTSIDDYTNADHEAFHNVLHLSALILRLTDDLGTSSAELKRGDVPKSVECYMHETGASEEQAREYIKKLIIETWKRLNKERMSLTSPSSRIFAECAANLGRMGHFTYQRGDIFGSPDYLYKSHQISLLFTPKS